MNIAVVDDEARSREALSHYVEKYSKETGRVLSVECFATADEFLSVYKKNFFSVVLMDIELPGIDGLAAARELRKLDDAVTLMFITKMSRYAQKGYEVNAIDFIIKPVNYADFCLKLGKAINIAEIRKEKSVMIKTESGFARIAVDRIEYIEVRGHKTTYKMVDGSIDSRGSLADLEKSLSEYGFLRCNSCYLVNSAFVKSVEGYDVTVGSEVLKISHPRRKSFVEALLNLYTGSKR